MEKPTRFQVEAQFKDELSGRETRSCFSILNISATCSFQIHVTDDLRSPTPTLYTQKRRLRVVKHGFTLSSLCPTVGNGTCSCGRCRCNEGYEGSACQCKVSQKACQTPNNTVCYGRGKCTCSRCECTEGYQRPHCKTCLGCPDPCQTKL